MKTADVALLTKEARPGPSPNLADYDTACRTFRWEDARAELEGLPGGGLNIAHEAVDRHVAAGLGGRLALRWIAKNGTVHDHSYADLARETARFARVLSDLSVGRGERVFSLLGRVSELYVAALGTLKAGAVFSPLFSAFGPEPVRARMTIGAAAVLVTTENFYRRKVEPWRKELPGLCHVLLTECSEDIPPGTHDLAILMAGTEARFETAATSPHDMALLHFTSGTTGKPKGAVHVHEAVVAHQITGSFAT